MNLPAVKYSQNNSMIRIYTLALLLFAAVASIQAQTLYKVERNGLYGYIDAANDTVIA